MEVNANQIQGLITDMVQDLILQEDSWVKRVFMQHTGKFPTKGTAHVRPLAARLGRGFRPAGYERGEEPVESVNRKIPVNYHAKRRTGFGLVTDEDKIDLEAGGVSDDAIFEGLKDAFQETQVALGIYGAALLFDTAFWGEYDLVVDGSGSFVNGGNPTRDFRNIRTQLVPGANMIVIPESDAIAIAETPSILGNFGAMGKTAGSIEMQAVVNWLRTTVGFDHVEIVTDLYNAADVAVEDDDIQPVLEPGQLWIGYKGGLHQFHPDGENQDTAEYVRQHRSASNEMVYHTIDDLVADQSAKGIVVTNTLTPA